jgi:flagellar motility protein MotE (MotC chaperone)
MNLTIPAILVLLFSLNVMAEELPLELKGTVPEMAPVKKVNTPSEALMKLLEERQQDLDRRETAVRRDEERLKLLRTDLEGMFGKPEKAGKAAGITAPGAKSTGGGAAVSPNLVHLSQAFETMPVEEAAQRIDKMNEAVALDLLGRLKGKTAGQILAALAPAKAARLVEKLAAQPRGANPQVSSERK